MPAPTDFLDQMERDPYLYAAHYGTTVERIRQHIATQRAARDTARRTEVAPQSTFAVPAGTIPTMVPAPTTTSTPEAPRELAPMDQLSAYLSSHLR